jgi:hypothetical protein
MPPSVAAICLPAAVKRLNWPTRISAARLSASSGVSVPSVSISRQLLAALGGEIADAALDGHVDLDRNVVRVERQEMLIWVDDLDVRVGLDVMRRDCARAGLGEPQLDGVRGVALEAQLLDVEHDRGDVLDDARDGAELVVDVAHLDRGHGSALER